MPALLERGFQDLGLSHGRCVLAAAVRQLMATEREWLDKFKHGFKPLPPSCPTKIEMSWSSPK